MNSTGPFDDEELDAIVDMIDGLMESGDGHVSIKTTDDEAGIRVKTYRSNDCGTKGACCQPTEDAIDNDDED